MWKPNLWSRVVGPLLLALAGAWFASVAAWVPAAIAVVAAGAIAASNNTKYVEVRPQGLRCQQIIRPFDLRWDEIAGSVVARPGFAICELVILDVGGRFRRTGVWRWRIPGSPGSLSDAASAINAHSTAIRDLADVDERQLRTVLDEYSRQALLHAAGVDELGAERRTDRMLGLWLLTLVGSAVVGGVLVALLGAFWPFVVVMALSVIGFFIWAARQPRLPPQRQAVRLTWFRTDTPRSNDPS